MSHCVPEWRDSTGDLDATIPFFGLSSSDSKAELQHHRKIDALDVANVPNQDVCLQVSHLDGGFMPMMSVAYGKVAKNGLGHRNVLSNFTQQIVNTNGTSTANADFSRDESSDSLMNTAVAGDPTSSLGAEDTLDFFGASIDEDMLAYLYPLDNPLDRSYSIDTLREPPSSQLSFHKGSLDFESCGDQLNSLPQNSKSALANKLAGAVTGVGTRHSAGYNVTGDVLEEPCCILAEPLTSKGPRISQANLLESSLQRPTFCTSFVGECQSTVAASSPMLLPRWQSTHTAATFSSSTSNTVPLNFACFSRPAALAKAALQTLGVSGAKGSNQLQQHSEEKNLEVNCQGGCSLRGSTNRSYILSSHETSVCFQGATLQQASSGQPKSADRELNVPSMQETVQIVGETTRQTGDTTDVKDRASELGKPPLASITGGTPHGDKSYQSASEVLETLEPTTTTSLACSCNSGEQTKLKLLSKGRKQRRESDDPTECQSQNAEDDSIGLEKPVRKSGSKRTRAAEVHNLSERRRRDRINEKMKALQELIPNSNKTDKASMLDEAIEYLKMLQHQLQMSVRSGLSMPPVLVSAGMQPLQVPHMAHMSGIGMERGAHMGMGMGMVDMGSGGTGRPLMFFPSIPGSSHLPTRPPTFSDLHERLSGPAAVEFYNRHTNGQQLQVPIQPINMNMYHPYMLQQWQQQIHSQQVHDHLQPSSTASCGRPQ